MNKELRYHIQAHSSSILSVYRNLLTEKGAHKYSQSVPAFQIGAQYFNTEIEAYTRRMRP